MRTLDGSIVSLSAQRGKIALLNFWATWCEPCRQEIPSLVQVHNTYRDRQVEVLGVAVHSNQLAIELWVENLQIPYPILLAGEEDEEVLKQYGVDRGIPRSVLIDRAGRIYKTYQGLPEGRETFARDIEALLAMDTGA